MSIVTLLAAVIAIRFAALFTAVIGLAGGFATPVLLSSGVDRPLAFFSYLSVLTAGFLYVAERRTWATITALALAGTSTLQLGWYASWMAPEKFLVGTGAFAVLGGIYLWHAVRLDDAERQLMHQAALTGALVPLGFAVLLATEPRFAPQWVGLIAFLTVLDVALVVVALVWRVPLLVGASALATGLVVTLLGDTAGAVLSASWGLPDRGYRPDGLLQPVAATRIAVGCCLAVGVRAVATSGVCRNGGRAARVRVVGHRRWQSRAVGVCRRHLHGPGRVSRAHARGFVAGCLRRCGPGHRVDLPPLGDRDIGSRDIRGPPDTAASLRHGDRDRGELAIARDRAHQE